MMLGVWSGRCSEATLLRLQGMWRTPHPDPDPLNGPPTGLSGASAIAMAYLPDGTVVFAERPHALAANVPNNPLLVNVGRKFSAESDCHSPPPDAAWHLSFMMQPDPMLTSYISACAPPLTAAEGLNQP